VGAEFVLSLDPVQRSGVHTGNGHDFMRLNFYSMAVALLGTAFLAGCTTPAARVGSKLPRVGDEIVVAGQYFHTGTPVVLWTDPGGYDAYRVERRFAPLEESSWEASTQAVEYLKTPNRYNLRTAGLSADEVERVRGGGWDLPTLQKVVDQFVLHYDVCGVSRQCFKVLHDHRGLSVHFMLDIDGTIYQTLDVKERAWHATTSNSRSVGIEIANMGAYRQVEGSALEQWYASDAAGQTRITIPERLGDGGVRTPDFVGRPARNEPVAGKIHGERLVQYDFTPEQYKALAHLTAALSVALPKIKNDYPRDAAGKLITTKLDEEALQKFQGVIGHYHIQRNKTDPGPALDWDYLINTARELQSPPRKSLPPMGHQRQRF
jgi:N-acetylmuramoyl-L-alanine amidase